MKQREGLTLLKGVKHYWSDSNYQSLNASLVLYLLLSMIKCFHPFACITSSSTSNLAAIKRFVQCEQLKAYGHFVSNKVRAWNIVRAYRAEPPNTYFKASYSHIHQTIMLLYIGDSMKSLIFSSSQTSSSRRSSVISLIFKSQRVLFSRSSEVYTTGKTFEF